MFSSYIYHPQKNTIHEINELLSYYKIKSNVRFIGDIGYLILGNYSKNVIYCYGNASSILMMITLANEYSKRNNVNVILFDYPGYGISSGSPSEESIVNSLKLIINQFHNVELIGESIGTGVVLSYMAKYQGYKVTKIYLISPFLSIISVVTENILADFMFSLLSDDKYENMWNIQFVKCPIEIYSLINDELIPYKHGVVLHQRIKNGRTDNDIRTILNHEYGHGNFGSLCKLYIKL